MSPKNEKEREIARLSDSLPLVTEEQARWAVQLARQTWEDQHPRGQYTYFAIPTACGDYQVDREFIMKTTYSKRNGTQLCYIGEAAQRWWDRDWNLVVLQKPHRMGWYYSDQPYSLSADFTIKRDFSTDYRRTIDVFSMNISNICKLGESYTDWAIEQGWDSIIGNIDALDIREMMEDTDKRSKMETIMKWHNRILADAFFYKPERILGYWRQVCKAQARGYFDNISISDWFDFMELADTYRKDIHNPVIYMPVDFKREHDRLVEKKAEDDRVAEEIKKIQTLKEMKEENDKYIAEKGKFFDICISDEHLDITPLKSVAEFQAEGEAMHHCVFHNGYYKQKNALILSARSKTGRRIATIELNISNFEIIQVRGKCNSHPSEYAEIIGLIKEHMKEFKMAMKGQKRMAA